MVQAMCLYYASQAGKLFGFIGAFKWIQYSWRYILYFSIYLERCTCWTNAHRCRCPENWEVSKVCFFWAHSIQKLFSHSNFGAIFFKHASQYITGCHTPVKNRPLPCYVTFFATVNLHLFFDEINIVIIFLFTFFFECHV